MVIGDELSNLTEDNKKVLVRKQITTNYKQNNDNCNGCFLFSSLLGYFFLFVQKFLVFLKASRE